MNHTIEKPVESIYSFLMEMDKLKNVTRRAYIFDRSRNENSAEHSWQTVYQYIDKQIDVRKDTLKPVVMYG